MEAKINLTSSYVDFLHPGINYSRQFGLYPVLALCVLLLSTSPGSGHLDRGTLLIPAAGERAGAAGRVVHMTPRRHRAVLHVGGAAEGLIRVIWPCVEPRVLLKVCVLRWTEEVRALVGYIVIL